MTESEALTILLDEVEGRAHPNYEIVEATDVVYGLIEDVRQLEADPDLLLQRTREVREGMGVYTMIGVYAGDFLSESYDELKEDMTEAERIMLAKKVYDTGLSDQVYEELRDLVYDCAAEVGLLKEPQ